MAERVQKTKQATEQKAAVEKVEPKAHQSDELLEVTDEVLADIDAALAETLGETTAEEFVAEYIQKGGE